MTKVGLCELRNDGSVLGDSSTTPEALEKGNAAATAASGARSAASQQSSVPPSGQPLTPPQGPRRSPGTAAVAGTSDEDRQTSGDMTEGNANSPTAARDAASFPASSPSSSGAPLAAQLHLQQQQQAAAVDKRSKLRHLKRGQPSPAAGGAGSDTASDTRTISLASTQTGSMVSRGANAVDGPSPRDVANNANLSSRHQSKLKKIKKKYAHQDDDDRQRAMAILGNNVSKVHQAMLQAEATADATNTDDDDDEGPAGSSSQRVKFAEDVDGAADGGDDGGEHGEDAMEREHEAMNRRASSFEDDTAKIAERMQEENANIVPYLDGAPAAAAVESGECVLEDAVVVCAPYAAIRHYTFKMRIAPGTDKKGQAAKAILESFTKHVLRAMPQAAAAMKAISLEQTIAQIAGPLKVHFADMTAPITTSGASGSAGATADGELASMDGLSVRQKQKLKQEQKEREMMEKLRAERKARLEAREKKLGAGGHADPSAGPATIVGPA
mmetsp:Transcript_7691/g.23997  ORF Transcript_7691/g.23997 Transcript_7691/m.23997 type:complete len:499 (-) Transcript_7691:772-2268(-)